MWHKIFDIVGFIGLVGWFFIFLIMFLDWYELNRSSKHEL